MVRGLPNKSQQCKTHLNTAFQPTRLLYIGGDSGSFHIVNTHFDSNLGPYFCLSHCWGGVTNSVPAPKNELRSVDEWDGNISVAKDIPRCHLRGRRLGIEYLWIDSLYTFRLVAYVVLMKFNAGIDASCRMMKTTGHSRLDE